MSDNTGPLGLYDQVGPARIIKSKLSLMHFERGSIGIRCRMKVDSIIFTQAAYEARGNRSWGVGDIFSFTTVIFASSKALDTLRSIQFVWPLKE